ncbi:ferric-dicitrate binding protein FerR, regulates iron transport through sigma-19 [Algoriphagus locisalis]|uniref:Ferric-dicitrate binding protein FerR, regulates iron transport through sigma-19 n=1 Tax=Algoriphagus locisalis TaxID=305507 RepID=A0A1I7E262_9BACT|nr:FecR domain-containing protein [Algoriphagus locisalis]SFU18020.1 ferric-dicitrate binding protein FerR, regulates iron transport through sigma-19 [Algoriphagus locisalis]
MNYHHPDYSDFSIEDYLVDPFFKEWVLYSTPEHDEFWMRWIKAHPEKSALLEEARSLVLSLENSKEEMSPEELKDVWSLIQEDVNMPPKSLETYRSKKYRWAVAAGVSSVLAVATLVYLLLLPKEIEFVTGFGETLEITLPDSSTVKLNSNSKLTYLDNWEGQTAREIEIEGEAFFNVVHKVDHQPFRVLSSQNVTIEVLGTEFNVYNRAEETEVILNSGMVTLSFPVKEKEGKIVMNPGDLVKFKDNKFKRERVNTSLHTSWKDNVLNLEQTSLAEMVKMARDNYGVTIDVENKEALELTASGSMPLTDSDSFLRQIALIFNVELTKENNKYLIK